MDQLSHPARADQQPSDDQIHLPTKSQDYHSPMDPLYRPPRADQQPNDDHSD